MVIFKWIKAVFTKPLVILKSIYFRLINKNTDLYRKRLVICNKCKHKTQIPLGEICDVCGCFIANKTRVEDEHCDLCKW